MVKNCTNCRADYWARWRNEPTTLCPACQAGAVLCARCCGVVTPPDDAAQLTLWPLGLARRRAPVPVAVEAYVYPGREKPTQAEKRRAPFH